MNNYFSSESGPKSEGVNKENTPPKNDAKMDATRHHKSTPREIFRWGISRKERSAGGLGTRRGESPPSRRACLLVAADGPLGLSGHSSQGTQVTQVTQGTQVTQVTQVKRVYEGLEVHFVQGFLWFFDMRTS